MAIFKNYIEGGIPENQRFRYGDASNIGNEPIVQKNIPLSVDAKVQNQNVFTKRTDDLTRISTILTQAPGLKYLANETSLQALTIKNDPNKSFIGNKIAQIGNGLIETVKTIGSTLAQVPLNGTGTHFVKGFNGTSNKTYLSGLSTAPHATVNNGGLVSPVFADLAPDTQRPVPGLPENDTHADLGEESGLARNINPNRPQLKNTQLTTGLSLPPQLFDKTKPDIRKEGKYSLGDPTRRVQDDLEEEGYARSLEKTLENNNIDLINFEPAATDDEAAQARRTGDPSVPQDFIKFKFKIITPEEENNKTLVFRAFLDTFDDNYSSNWNTWNYNGRAENFYTYGNFERTLNIGFKIAAQSRHEMKPLYQKMIQLASVTAPTYNNNTMRGTFVEVTIGDYLVNTTGFISNLSYTWQNNYPWEIALDRNNLDSEMQELPTVLDCSLNFTPIHKFVPQTGLLPYITTDLTQEDRSYFPTNENQ